jgi:hypothetical protein
MGRVRSFSSRINNGITIPAAYGWTWGKGVGRRGDELINPVDGEDKRCPPANIASDSKLINVLVKIRN